MRSCGVLENEGGQNGRVNMVSRKEFVCIKCGNLNPQVPNMIVIS